MMSNYSTPLDFSWRNVGFRLFGKTPLALSIAVSLALVLTNENLSAQLIDVQYSVVVSYLAPIAPDDDGTTATYEPTFRVRMVYDNGPAQNSGFNQILGGNGAAFSHTVTNVCPGGNAFIRFAGWDDDNTPLAINNADDDRYPIGFPNSFNGLPQTAVLAITTFSGTSGVINQGPFVGADGGTYSLVITYSWAPAATIFSLLASNDGPYCLGQTVNLNTTVTAPGAVTYTWDGPNVVAANASSTTAPNAPVGTNTYSVTASLANGCFVTASTDADVRQLPSLTASNNSPICENTALDVSVVDANGLADTYTWDRNSWNADVNSLASAALTTTGTYNVTATNSATGCSATATTNVTVDFMPAGGASNNSPLCVGQTLNISYLEDNGRPVDYSWSPNTVSPATGNDPNPTSNIASLALTDAGDYTVTMVNPANAACSITRTTAVTVNDNPNMSLAFSTNPICEGQQVTVTATDANSLADTYTWTTPNQTVGNVSVTDFTTILADAGNYDLTATNSATGCSATATASLTVDFMPSAVVSNNSPLCVGESLDVDFNDANGNAVDYSWSPNTVTPNSGTAINATSSIAAVALSDAGVYTVTLVNPANAACSVTASTAVTVNDNPSMSLAFSNSTICEGLQVTLTATDANSLADTYTWVAPNQTIGNVSVTSFSTVLADAGNYDLTATNSATGCSATATTPLTVNATPTPVAASPGAHGAGIYCEGETIDLACTPNGATSFSWSGGSGTFNDATLQNPQVTGAASGVHTYIVLGTDGNGCTASTSVNVTVNANPTVTAVQTPDPIVCQRGTISVSATNTLGSGAIATYNWATTAGGGFAAAINTQSVLVTNNAQSNNDGDYTVTITDVNGCTATDVEPVSVTIITPPSYTSAPICFGQVANLNAVTGGSNGTFTWYSANNYTSQVGTGASFNTAAVSFNPTNYWMSETDPVTGCVSNLTAITLTPNAVPNAPAATGVTTCEGSTANLTATVGAGETAEWFFDALGQNSMGTGLSVTTPVLVQNGVFYVRADNGLCKGPLTAVTVTVIAKPALTISNDGPKCDGEIVGMVATGGGSYLWSNGDNTASSTATVSGTYTVTVTNVAGCASTISTVVVVRTNPTAGLSASAATICRGESVTLTATGGSSYAWSTGEASSSIVKSPTNNATYSVSVYNSFGCVSTASTSVAVNALPVATISGPSTFCQGETVTLSTAGGEPSYAWSNGATVNTTDITSGGTFTVTVTAANACTATASYNVVRNNRPTVSITPQGPTTFCVGGSVVLRASGSIANYGWSTGDVGTNTITVTPVVGANIYTVTAESSQSCQTTASVTVTVNPLPVISFAGMQSINCTTPSTSITVTSVPAANAVVWSNGSTFSPTTFSNTLGAAAGSVSYTATVTDVNGCRNSASLSISEDFVAPTADITPNRTLVNCTNPTASLDATTSNATYAWSTGATTASISVGAAGTYSVTITDTVNGCTSTDSQVITEDFAAPTVTIAGTTHINCNTPSTTVTASGANTYVWSTSATTSTEDFIQGEAGVYTVVGTTTANGCTASANVTITEDFVAPTVTIAGTTHINCNTPSTTVTASGADTYVWLTSAATSTEDFIQGEAGVYSVVGTTTANGCTASANVTITEDFVAPTVTIAGTTHINCNTPSTTVTASGADTYVWSTSATTSTEDFIQGEANVYTVVGTTTANGCTASASVTITEDFVAPTVTIAGTTHINCNTPSTTVTASGADTYVWSTSAATSTEDFIQGEANVYSVVGTTTANGCTASANVTITEDFVAPTVTIAGTTHINCNTPSTTVTASGADTYVWSTSANTSTEDFIQGEANVYSVVGTTTANGCTASANVTITEDFVAPTVTIAGTTHINCNTPSTTVTASGADTYVWSSGSNVATEDFVQTEAGVYTVVGTRTSNGCTASANVTITEDFVNPTAVITPSGPTAFCAGGSVNLVASGGVSYAWSTGATTSSITASTSNTYRVTATAANGCVGTASVVVTVTAIPGITITSGPLAFCKGGASNLFSGTNAAAPSYVWNVPFNTSPLIIIDSEPANVGTFNAPVGVNTYSVTVSDGTSGCSSTASFNVTVYDLPVATIVPNGPTTFCQGNSVDLVVPSGNTYAWSTGATSNSINVTTGGTFRVTVTTSNGCTATDNESVVVNSNPTVTITPAGPTTFCAGGSVNLVANGTGGVNYSWSNGANSTNNITVNAAATYSVTATNSNNCTATDNEVVSVNANPTVTIAGPTQVSCLVPSVTVTASGANTYVWSSGSTLATEDFVQGEAGTYRVTGTDGNSCIGTASVLITDITAAPIANITPNRTLVNCTNPTASLDATTSNATYAWSTGATTASISVGAAGTFNVTITDTVNGCTSTDSQVITEDFVAPTIVFAGATHINCNTPSTTVTASGADTYVWSTSATTSTEDFIQGEAGVYSVVGTRTSNGCTASANVTITEDFVAPTVTIAGTTHINCNTPSTTVTASGADTYVWSTSATTSTEDFIQGEAGVYTVVGTTTANGCTASANVTITEDFVAPTVAIAGTTHINCNTPSTTVTSSGADTYVWSTGAVTSTEDFIQGEAGVYTVVGTTTANGCTASANVTITEDFVAPTVTIAGTTHINCNTPSTTVTASGADTYVWSTSATTSTEDFIQGEAGVYSIVGTRTSNGCTASANVTITEDFVAPTVTIAGTTHINCNTPSTTVTASGADTYVWSTSANTSTEDFIQGEAGVYTVVGTTTANGCTASANVTITEDFVAPTVTIAGTTHINCNTPSTTVTASGANTYIWSTSATTSTEDFIQGEAGVYSVTGTALNGCTATANVTITEDFVAPTVTIAGTTHINCTTPSTTVTASGADTYVWSSGSNVATEDFVQTESGVYTIVGRTTSNGCTASENVTITEDFVAPTPVATAGGPTTFCNGGSVVLSVTGGVNYLWSNGDTNASTTVTASGNYTAVATSANGCTATSNAIAVINNPNPIVTINTGGPVTFCEGGISNLQANSNVSFASYQWNQPSANSALVFIDSRTGSPTRNAFVGTQSFIVTVTDNNTGCFTTASQTVTVFPTPSAVVTAAGPTTFCQGGSVDLSVPASASYLWSNGATTQTINVTTANTYTVTVTSANGCSATGSQQVVVEAIPVVIITPSGATSFCTGGSVNLAASGSPGVNYSWSNGSSSNNVTVNTSGNYSVTATSFNGCTAADSELVTVFVNPTVVITGTTHINCNTPSTTVTASGADTYVWSTSAATSTEDFIQGEAGVYTVVGTTTANGCTASANVTITEDFVAPTVAIAGTTHINCNTPSTTVTASGADTYVWSTSANTSTEDFIQGEANVYSVVGTITANGCTASANVTITEDFVAPVISFSGATHINCNTPSTTVTASGADTYVWSTGATTSTEDFIQGEAGVYTVVGTTTANGCTASANVTITEDFVAPTVTIAGTTHINCNTPSTTVTASGADSYVWSTNATTSTEDFIQGEAGVYTVVGTTTANGCTASANVTITEDFVAPTVTIAGTTHINCNTPSTTVTASGADTYVWSTSATTSTEDFIQGEAGVYTVVGTTTANGCTASANVTITEDFVAPTVTIAGTTQINCTTPSSTVTASGADTYVWSTSATTSTEDFIQGEAGVYTVVGTTTANGCTASANVTITEDFVAPTVTIAGTTHINCNTPSTTVTASGADTYVWSTSATTSTEDFIQGEAGVYSVTGTALNGCTATANVTITEDFVAPTASISTGATVINCSSPTTTFTATGGVSYLWSDASTASTVTASQGNASYAVTVTAANGCTATASSSVAEDFVVPTVVVTPSGPTSFCFGGNVDLAASGAVSYVWSNGATTASINVSVTNTYTVTGTAANGCVDTDVEGVTVTPAPSATITAGGPVSFCEGGILNIQAATNASNPSYVWNAPFATSSLVLVDSRASSSTRNAIVGINTFIVTITDGTSGCTSTSSINIEVFPAPSAVITPNGPTTFCQGGSVTLNVPTSASYAWSNGATTSSNNVSTTNTYTVSVTSINGCSATSSVAVQVNAVPTVTITPSGVTTFCQGSQVTLTAAGSAANYAWSNGVSGINTIVVNASGLYSVTASNGLCESVASVSVTVHPAATATASVTDDVICFGESVTFTSTGGVSAAWDNGVTEGVAIAPAASNSFNVTVTDINGCTATANVNVTVNANPTATATVTDDVICFGESVTFTSTGGVSAAWDNGVTEGVAIAPAASNTFNVTVTDINGCIATANVNVTVNANPIATATVTDDFICFGESVTFTSTGGLSAAWDNGVTEGVAIAPAASNTFNVTVTDINGCTATANVNVTVNANPVIGLTVTDDFICFGESVTFTSTGGTPVWDNAVLDGVAFAPTATNTYGLTVTDINGCTATTSVNVTVNSNPTATATVTDDVICFGESVTFTSTGGVSAAWNNGVTEAVAIAPTASNTFNVTVTDINGCTATASVNVTVEPLPVITVSVTDNFICLGDSIILSSTGGTPAWDNGVVDGVIFAPTATNTYTVIITGANGCTVSASLGVTVNAVPSAGLAFSSNTICERGGVTISESVASANTNFTIANYTFSGPRFATSVSGTNSSVAFGNAAGSNTGTYTVSITDVNGCTSSSSAVLTVNVVTPPVVTNTSAPCFGTATTLSATAGGNVSWYTNYSSALVYTGAIGQGNTFTTAPLNTNPVIYYAAADSAGCSSNMTTFTIVPLPIPSAPTVTNVTVCEGSAATLSCTVSAGNTSEWFSDALGQVSLGVAPTVNTGILTQDAVYYVRAISANGCNSSLASVMVTVNQLPVVIATASDMSICLGDSTRLVSSGGTPVWDNGAIEGAFVSPTTSIIYSVTVTNAAGCTATAGVLIDVNTAPTLTAGVSAATVCAGTSVSITVTGSATRYVWNNGLTTRNFSATPATTTTYTVTGTNIYGCAGTASVIVNVNPLPSVQAITSAASICVGDSTTLDANGAASYVWSNAATTSQTGFRATVAGNFAFDVTGTDANGCSNTSSVSVEVRPLPTITAAAQPAAVCVGQSSVLQASGGVSYVWGNAAGNFALVTVAPVTTTAYVVTATAANGCTNTASVTVTLNLSPTVTIAPDTAICLGGTAVLTASGATNFVWSNGTSTASVSVSPRTNTTYSVIGTDANGCTASDATAVTVNALPVINTTALPASICVGDSTTVAATGAVTYVWSPNGTGASFRAAPASNTTFAVTGTDALGCSATSAVLVEVRSLPTPQVTALPAAVCPGGGSVLNVVGGAAFAWSTGSVFNIVPVSPTATTTYIVTVTGFNGCSTTASTTVTVNAAPAVTVTNLAGATAQCEGDTLRLVATNTGAAINNYAWSTPARNVNINNDTLTIANINKQDNQGFYDLVVTDANGCTASTFALVNVVGAIPTSLVATNLTGPACPGANFRLTADRTSDPVAATNYAWSGPNSFTAATRDAIVTAATSAANGIYTVTVSRGTCPAVTATTEVEVYPAPALAVTPASATITQGETLQLDATGAATYRWDFPADVAIYAGNINISNPLVISNVPATYVITVTGYSQNSCAATATMSLLVEPQTEPESPNIITPEDADGFNDLLEIAYLNNLTQGYSLSIIDRAGNELKTYENNFTSWDGRIDGQLVPAGTYWWIVKTTDNKVFRGVFTVIR